MRANTLRVINKDHPDFINTFRYEKRIDFKIESQKRSLLSDQR
jgi:hypothetical protein